MLWAIISSACGTMGVTGSNINSNIAIIFVLYFPVIYLWRASGHLRGSRWRLHGWGIGWGRGWGLMKKAGPRGWGRIPKLGIYSTGPSLRVLQRLLKKMTLMDQKGQGYSTWKLGSQLGLGFLFRTLLWANPGKLFKLPSRNGVPLYMAWLWPRSKGTHSLGDPKTRQFCSLTAQQSKLVFGGRMNGWGRMGHQKRRMNNAWTPWACVGKMGLGKRLFGMAKGKTSKTLLQPYGEKRNSPGAPQYHSWMALYQRIPLKTLSRLWGQFHQLELPVWLRTPAFSLYIWMFRCRLQDAVQEDLSKYRNLSDFFRRQLKPGLRPIDKGHILTSPADGQVLHFGRVECDLLEQVKGITYSLGGFLGPVKGLLKTTKPSRHPKDKPECGSYARLLLQQPHQHDLYYCVVYLSPGDYHRFHSPTDWTVTARRHFPGDLYSVSPRTAEWLRDLFVLNERAVYVGQWRYGFFSMTPVGATNVGSINVNFDKSLETNKRIGHPKGSYFDCHFSSRRRLGVAQKQGELMGDFNFGSTVVLLFEAPRKFQFSIQYGQKIKFGQGMGRVGHSSALRKKNSISM